MLTNSTKNSVFQLTGHVKLLNKVVMLIKIQRCGWCRAVCFVWRLEGIGMHCKNKRQWFIYRKWYIFNQYAWVSPIEIILPVFSGFINLTSLSVIFLLSSIRQLGVLTKSQSLYVYYFIIFSLRRWRRKVKGCILKGAYQRFPSRSKILW